VNRRSAPMLLIRSSRLRRTVSSSASTHSQGSAFPNRGWSTGYERRTNPAPPQMPQTSASSSSAVADDVSERSAEIPSLLVFERIWSRRFIGSALLGPVLEHLLDIAP